MIRLISIIMLIIGALGLLVSCQMDTSVPTSFGRVINFPLAAQQQNMALVSAVLFLAGIILFATSKLTQLQFGIGVDGNISQQYTTAFEKRVTSAYMSVRNEIYSLSLKECLEIAAIFFTILIICVISFMIKDIYVSSIIAASGTCLYVKYILRSTTEDVKPQFEIHNVEVKTQQTTDKYAIAIVVVLTVVIGLYFLTR